jgi:cell pole-organizing protein PopZ
MSEQIAQEPTMEEILASIRRIISEDEAPADTHAAPDLHAVEPAPAPEPQAEPEEEDVLELNQPYEVEAADTMDDIETAPRFEAAPYHPEPPREEPAPAYAASFQAAPAAPAESGLVDEPIAHSVASAFASLSMNLAMPREGRTLEDLVKELMYPILRDWLNQNLPSIVEAQVRAEVDRLSRLRGIR